MTQPRPGEARMHSTLPRICLLAGYFGTLPTFFDCFLRSCELNPTIDWVILTDDPRPWDLPRNVQILPTRLDNLQRRFSDTLGFPVNLSRPYLLCDFRPAFGVLFEEIFRGYDFWGHCDLDMVFGSVREFLTVAVLGRFDRILQRGHLSLYRNTSEMNGQFMRPAPGAMDYRAVFQDARYFNFDEWRGIYRILRFYDVPQYREEIIADLRAPTPWVNTRLEATELPNYPLQAFYWSRGRTFQAFMNREMGVEDREVLYIHFQKRRLPKPGFDARHCDGFVISPDGFRPYGREHITEEKFREWNRQSMKPIEELKAEVLRKISRLGGRITGVASDS